MKKITRFILTPIISSMIFAFNVKAATVVDIIAGSADHDTLEAAVVTAGLADDLSGEGPFTVFAPTDNAFKALPAGTIETLLSDPTGDLADILLYHVVSGKAMSGGLSNNQMIATLFGKEVKVTINGEGVFINNAKVTVADIEADNGVVHVINAVLLPPVETGILERSDELKQLGIYPNPASDFMVISTTAEVDSGNLKIVNTNGVVLIDRYLDNLSSPVDISMLEKGLYFVMMESLNDSFKGKLLVK